jgi:hypothetical protein
MGSVVPCSEGINMALTKVDGAKRDKGYAEMRIAHLIQETMQLSD